MPYICSKCLQVHPLFHLSCPDCGAWNSIQNQATRFSHVDAHPVALPNIVLSTVPRTKTTIEQFDALLGGGFVSGSSILLIGAPGAGKSTLVMQLLKKIRLSSLYVSGEESLQHLKLRADRLKINSPGLLFLFETNVNKILSHVERCRPGILVIDSIQTVYTDVSGSLPGGPAQIRKCCYILRRAAQQTGFILVLVGQVTKGEKAAGPKMIEHAVDVVLYLAMEEGRTTMRALSASKNRFGSTTPRCMLRMDKSGLVFLPAASARRDEGP